MFGLLKKEEPKKAITFTFYGGAMHLQRKEVENPKDTIMVRSMAGDDRVVEFYKRVDYNVYQLI